MIKKNKTIELNSILASDPDIKHIFELVLANGSIGMQNGARHATVAINNCTIDASNDVLSLRVAGDTACDITLNVVDKEDLDFVYNVGTGKLAHHIHYRWFKNSNDVWVGVKHPSTLSEHHDLYEDICKGGVVMDKLHQYNAPEYRYMIDTCLRQLNSLENSLDK